MELNVVIRLFPRCRLGVALTLKEDESIKGIDE